jgi:hypothetical protein
MLNQFKRAVKTWPGYQQVHVARHAGIRHLIRRERIVRRIDGIKPHRTRPWRPLCQESPIELHMLLHAQDVRLALWSLHSFYTAAQVDWPIVFHQGGRMGRRDWDMLHAKFPDAYALQSAEADAMVEPALRKREMNDAIDIRRNSPTLHKLIDPPLLSTAVTLFMLDADVLFFREPLELLSIAGKPNHLNTFNRDDLACPYSISFEHSKQRLGRLPAEHINTGICLLNCAGICFDRIKLYLNDPEVTSDRHFIEQTILALLAGEFGYALLPDTYCCSKLPGLRTPTGEPLIAKHYIETPRPLLFEEGIPRILSSLSEP